MFFEEDNSCNFWILGWWYSNFDLISLYHSGTLCVFINLECWWMDLLRKDLHSYIRHLHNLIVLFLTILSIYRSGIFFLLCLIYRLMFVSPCSFDDVKINSAFLWFLFTSVIFFEEENSSNVGTWTWFDDFVSQWYSFLHVFINLERWWIWVLLERTCIVSWVGYLTSIAKPFC